MGLCQNQNDLHEKSQTKRQNLSNEKSKANKKTINVYIFRSNETHYLKTGM
jgi:hypothetical protein